VNVTNCQSGCDRNLTGPLHDNKHPDFVSLFPTIVVLENQPTDAQPCLTRSGASATFKFRAEIPSVAIGLVQRISRQQTFRRQHGDSGRSQISQELH
jgi:hypothetical protein